LSRRLTVAKGTPERAWLGEVSAVALQQSLADLHRAYANYFLDLKRVKAARGEKAKLRVASRGSSPASRGRQPGSRPTAVSGCCPTVAWPSRRSGT
jgi:transposase